MPTRALMSFLSAIPKVQPQQIHGRVGLWAKTLLTPILLSENAILSLGKSSAKLGSSRVDFLKIALADPDVFHAGKARGVENGDSEEA